MDPDKNLKSSSTRLFRWVPWFCVILALLSNLGARLIQLPLLRTSELGLCRRYYAAHDPSLIDSDGNVEERFCKIGPVQQKVAYMMGILQITSTICELVEIIPFGVLSDKYGRNLFLFLQGITTAASSAWLIAVAYFYRVLPIESLLVMPVFALFSGGSSVATANLFALIADCVQDETQRTKTFGYLNATSQFFLLLGPVIASSTMSIGLLAPIWISVVVNLLSSLIVVLLPDTRQSIHRQSDASNDNPRPAEQEALLPGSSGQVSLSSERFSLTNFLGTIKRTVLRELQAMRLLFAASRNVRLCLLVLLVTRLGASSIDILIQYISIRYGWTYAEAGYLFSLKAAVSLVLFIIFIPLCLKFLTKNQEVSKVAANLIGMKLSIVALGIGALAISLSIKVWMFIPALVLFILGFGLTLFTQTLLVSPQFSHVDSQFHARIYSIVGFVEGIGILLAVPILTATWAVAIKISDIGLGLPFLLCALSYFAIGIVIWKLKA